MKITDERENNQVSFYSLTGGDIIKYHSCYYIILDMHVFDTHDDDDEYNVVDIEDGSPFYIYSNETVELITNYEFIIK